MDLFPKIMWGIAILASIVFIIQMVMTFVGMDSDGDISGDVETDTDDGSIPFQLFTFRNLINFLLGFSWTGVAFYGTIENKLYLTILATFMGLLLVALVMLLFYALSKTIQSGNIDISESVGLVATVYFPIPAARSRAGKIQVNVHGAVREYDAMTDGNTISTGQLVKVLEVVEGNILLVEEVKPE